MIYIIVSNIGFALMTLVIYFRYSHFRISSGFKIRDLDKRIENEIADKSRLEINLRNDIRSENDQVKKLLRDLESIHKEKEEELKLRFEAEKQIELALQKVQEVQKRMDNWKTIQNASIQDSQEVITKIGNDLFHKLTKYHKDESEESRSVIEGAIKVVSSHLDDISKNVKQFSEKTGIAADSANQAISSASSSIAKAAPIQLDEFTKKKLSDVVSLIKLSGHLPNKNYILASSIDDKKAKLLLCELIFLKDQTLYLIDLKANRYFQEYDKLKSTNKEAALMTLRSRLDKYLAYISNPKYIASIEKLVVNTAMKYSKIKVAFAVNSHSEISILKELKYTDKIESANVTLLDIDAVNDLVL